MEDTTNTGGPAFPIADPFLLKPQDEPEMVRIAGGMTLRDYFAAKAMGSLCHGLTTPNEAYVAARAYEIADAMLRTREGS